MKMGNPKYAKTLKRREARARRSKWLGRVTFYCAVLGMTFTLRMNPTLTNDIAGYIATNASHQGAAALDNPSTSSMPKNRVKVRKGISRNLEITPQDSQDMADDLGRDLSEFRIER